MKIIKMIVPPRLMNYDKILLVENFNCSANITIETKVER